MTAQMDHQHTGANTSKEALITIYDPGFDSVHVDGEDRGKRTLAVRKKLLGVETVEELVEQHRDKLVAATHRHSDGKILFVRFVRRLRKRMMGDNPLGPHSYVLED
jgi:hypothetical protein